MIYPVGGTIDGVNGDYILLASPFIIDEGDIAGTTERLARSIQSSVELIQKKCKRFLPNNRIVHFKQQNGKFAKKRGGWL